MPASATGGQWGTPLCFIIFVKLSIMTARIAACEVKKASTWPLLLTVATAHPFHSCSQMEKRGMRKNKVCQ